MGGAHVTICVDLCADVVVLFAGGLGVRGRCERLLESPVPIAPPVRFF